MVPDDRLLSDMSDMIVTIHKLCDRAQELVDRAPQGDLEQLAEVAARLRGHVMELQVVSSVAAADPRPVLVEVIGALAEFKALKLSEELAAMPLDYLLDQHKAGEA